MKVVFLYSEPMPNVITVIKALIRIYSAEIHVVYWDRKKQTPFTVNGIDGVTFYERSKYGFDDIKKLINKVCPNAIYVVGWMDYTYLGITALYRSQGIPIFVGFDDIWEGTLRQVVASLFSPILTKIFFSHAWVSGPRQYEYAKRLGFSDKHIVSNLLTCDSNLFEVAFDDLHIKQKNYPNVFLFVGRFAPAKGINLLVDAFEKYRLEYNGDWKLICIGNGPLLSELTDHPNIEVYDFSSQSELVNRMRLSGVFVLASVRDVSPVVVHEAACAGLPMILSSSIGNIPLFMIHKYNGLVFDSGSSDSLALAMHHMATKSADDLVLMGKNSHDLSRRISPEISAASFVSCIESL